jgi:hypothetical protein
MSLGRFGPDTMQELMVLAAFHPASIVRIAGDGRVKVLCPTVFGKDGVSNWITCCGSSLGPEDSGRKQTGFHNPPKLGEQVLYFYPGLNVQQPAVMRSGPHFAKTKDPQSDNTPTGSYGS